MTWPQIGREFVSMRAATPVEVLSSPSSVAGPLYFEPGCAPPLAFGRLVEKTELRLPIFG